MVIVNQYCQWDGYPTGQGRQVMEFVRRYCHGDNLKEFKNRLKKSHLLIPVAGSHYFTGAPAARAVEKLDKLRYESHSLTDSWLHDGIADGSITKQEARYYLTASRDTGPYILQWLMDSEPEGMRFYTDEYCYKIGAELDWQIEGLFVINLDAETVIIDWHGHIREYSFSKVENMTDNELKVEMESLEGIENELGN